MSTVGEVLLQRQQWLKETYVSLIPEVGHHYAALSDAHLREAAYHTVNVFVQSVVEHNQDYMHQRWFNIAQTRIGQSFAIEETQGVVSLLRRITLQLLAEVYASDQAGHLAAVMIVEELFHVARLALAQGFEQQRARMRSALEHEMESLAAPVVPVYNGVLVLPLVGNIDERRAELVMSTLLNMVARTQAQVIIVDITGVPIVDRDIAHYLLNATKAVTLLGAKVVLAGVSPTVAQTVVQLGVDLSVLTTFADLSAALSYALAKRGLAIQPISPHMSLVS